jgi:hypothetical protein
VAIQEVWLDGFWIHCLLEANGVESHVVDPASIAVPRRRAALKSQRPFRLRTGRMRRSSILASGKMLSISPLLGSRIADRLVGVDPAPQFWAIFSVLFLQSGSCTGSSGRRNCSEFSLQSIRS